ncbi:MAG TPA: hypothetical protein VN538_07890 [Clostridia bacterium]|nr:hypothetical protein [Clostridia bacterium]
MLHDLYLMSAKPSLNADARRNYDHRTLTFEEMAASCTQRANNAAARKSRTTGKNLFLAVIEGVTRA